MGVVRCVNKNVAIRQICLELWSATNDQIAEVLDILRPNDARCGRAQVSDDYPIDSYGGFSSRAEEIAAERTARLRDIE